MKYCIYDLTYKNIEAVNLIILVITYALVGLVLCIKRTKESCLIKKINKKLQEKVS